MKEQVINKVLNQHLIKKVAFQKLNAYKKFQLTFFIIISYLLIAIIWLLKTPFLFQT